jgi:hypothetical protein
MFIFGGTTEEMETLSYLGVVTCQNCGNPTHHILNELIRSASVYFVPVANWRTGRYAVCEGCNAGTEVSDDQVDYLLRECRQIPKPSRYVDILDGLLAGWQQEAERAVAAGQKNVDFAELQQAARREVQGKFPEAEIDFVHNWTFAAEQLRVYGALGLIPESAKTLLKVLG